MYVFISQPMNGLSEEEIKETRDEIFNNYKERHPSAELIDSYLSDEVQAYAANARHIRSQRVWCLGQSLGMLSQADVILMAPGWEGTPGCRIEQKVATYYDIPIEYVR